MCWSVLAGYVWRFPEMGLPLNPPFQQDFFITNHPEIRDAPFWETPTFSFLPNFQGNLGPSASLTSHALWHWAWIEVDSPSTW